MSMRNTMKHSFASGFGMGLGWAAASATVRAVGSAVSSLSQPSSYHCVECGITVPPSTTVPCPLCHTVNTVSHTHCTSCHTELCIPCSQCKQPCAFKLSTGKQISQGVSNMGQTVKNSANQAATSAKDLVKKPRTVDCARCTQPLVVPPRESYACQYCNTTHANPTSDEPECSTCHGKQKLPQQQVTCQRCTHVQTVPSLKITHDLKQGWDKVRVGLKKVAWTVTHTPHVQCPRCTTHVKLQPPQAPPQQPHNEHNAHCVVAADGEWQVVAPQAVAPGTAPVSAPAPAPAPPAASMLTCPSCQHRFYVGDAASAPYPASASAPAPAPAAHPKSS